MNCIHTIELNSSFTLKDFFPLIGTIITVVGGYYFLTVQARKNRRLKLIDDLRSEIKAFYSLCVKSHFKQLEDGEMILCINAVTLLVDTGNKLQKELITKMTEINNQMVEQPLKPIDYEGFMNLAQKVMNEMIKKI